MTTVVGHKVSIAKAAEHFEVSRQSLSKQVKKLEAENRLVVERKGRQRLVDLQALAKLRGETLAPTSPADAGGIGDLKRKQAQTDLELAQMKLAKQRGELVSIKDLETALVDCGKTISQNWLQLFQIADEIAAAAAKGGADAVRKILKAHGRKGLDTITAELTRVVGEDNGGEGS